MLIESLRELLADATSVQLPRSSAKAAADTRVLDLILHFRLTSIGGVWYHALVFVDASSNAVDVRQRDKFLHVEFDPDELRETYRYVVLNIEVRSPALAGDWTTTIHNLRIDDDVYADPGQQIPLAPLIIDLNSNDPKEYFRKVVFSAMTVGKVPNAAGVDVLTSFVVDPLVILAPKRP